MDFDVSFKTVQGWVHDSTFSASGDSSLHCQRTSLSSRSSCKGGTTNHSTKIAKNGNRGSVDGSAFPVTSFNGISMASGSDDGSRHLEQISSSAQSQKAVNNGIDSMDGYLSHSKQCKIMVEVSRT